MGEQEVENRGKLDSKVNFPFLLTCVYHVLQVNHNDAFRYTLQAVRVRMVLPEVTLASVYILCCRLIFGVLSTTSGFPNQQHLICDC